MANEQNKLISLECLREIATRIKKEYLTAISKSGHVTMKKVSVVPTPADAEENILYLVKNQTGKWDIYAFIDGSVEWIDDMAADLEGYVTDQDLNEAVSQSVGGEIDNRIATDAEVEQAINAVFTPKSYQSARL